MRRVGILLVLVLLCGSALAQEPTRCGAPADLGDGWSFAAPADVGLDADALCGIDRIVAEWPQAEVHAVVVTRHGKLIAERYYSTRFTPETKHHLHSISKSVTSMLVGIALGERRFPSLGTPVLDLLGEYTDLRTPEKARIAFRHLLTMSSGLAWDELHQPYGDPDNSWSRLRTAPDPIRYVLERPVIKPAGVAYNYSSGGTEVLGAALARTTGRRVDDYAREKLFGPLGISDFDWEELPVTGQPAASAGLRLRPRDTAKLGQLMLNDGLWQGQRVLPGGWAAEATKPHLNGARLYQYGYQWWLGRSWVGAREIDWAAGVGYGGQRLYIVPTFDLVVVVNSGLYGRGSYSSLREKIPNAILGDVLAAAARN